VAESPQPGAADTARYDAYYYAHDCGTPYQRNDAWLGFFDRVAAWIHRTIGPATVLDAGCAFGFLVEKLRERGVEAWGLDISEYAIARVDAAVAPYCRVGSVLEPFGRRYDLIVCIEVLEHLAPADGLLAIANLAEHTDDVLFSSTPHDYRELTHERVQSPDRWAVLFAGQGLLRDLDYDASYLTDWAMRFRRGEAALGQVVAGYERALWRATREAQGRRELAVSQRLEIMRLEAAAREAWRRREVAEAEVAPLKAENAELEKALRDLRWQLDWRAQQVAELQTWHDDVVASPGWQVARRLQDARGRLAPAGSRREGALSGALRRVRLGNPGGSAPSGGVDAPEGSGSGR
jgi:SAM-dependent methyltransferase